MRVSNLCNVVDMVAHCDRGAQDRGLRVACWLKLGEWTIAESIQPGSAPMSESLQIDVLTAYKRATASSNCGYKAWHAWALINFRLAQQINDSPGFRLDASYGSKLVHPGSKSLRNHVIAAVKGFVSAICLGTKRWSASVQQDLLNFLTCLFNFGELPEVAETINTLISSVKIEAWLGVLPQLLARIHIKSPSVRSVLHPLLIRLGAAAPSGTDVSPVRPPQKSSHRTQGCRRKPHDLTQGTLVFPGRRGFDGFIGADPSGNPLARIVVRWI